MALILKSERQLQAKVLAKLIAQLSLNDVNPGSVIDVISQAVAQEDFALYYQIAQVSRLSDLEALTGQDLDDKSFEYGITRKDAQKTKGKINILRASTFVKVSTTFYAGSPAPISGDFQIDVNDASSVLIGSAGTLILGRGSNNEEEVAYTVAPTNNVNFYRFTLTSALTKDHAVEETVILKQGSNEQILAGSIVVVPATGVNAEIQFQIDNDTTLLAGEDKVMNVEVTAIEAGSAGNIPIAAIEGEASFPSAPFIGARAYNPNKFTTGRDREQDDELRDRIKSAIQGISKGVKQAILNAIVGLVDPETAKRVVSASIVLPLVEAGAVKVYIDDGTGFEPSFISQGFETVLGSSTGGEQRLQVDQFPVAKAQIENNVPEAYDMSSGALTLILQVGNLQETITFNVADFQAAAIATAEEIVAVINDRSNLVEARTSEVGSYVLITAKADINESIQVVGGSANNILNFPTDRKNTIELYIDDVKKSKDGETAVLDSGNQAPYNLSLIGAFPQTLNITVDGKTANNQTATFQNADAADATAVTAAEICAVLNRDLVGITATPINSGAKVRITSLTKLSSTSKLKINSGTLNDATNGLNFATTEKVGVDGDYTFNRELGIIELTNPLLANQNVTLGSLFTRGRQRAGVPELYAPTNGQTLVISVDGGADQTVTFDNSFAGGKTATLTAAFINAQLKGATAIVREIGISKFVEITTNSYQTSGTIESKSASTANGAFAFTLDTPQSSSDPNKAFLVSSIAGPYSFAEGDSLVAVVDNNIVSNTFAILMNYNATITNSTSPTVFRDSALSTIFPTVTELVDYYIAFKTGANTLPGIVESVTDQGSGIFRYTFNPVPGSFASFAVAGNLFNISDLDDSENNGKFVIQAAGASYVDVKNIDGVNATAQVGSAILSQRRQVTAYNNLTGEVTVNATFFSTPTIGDTFVVIPSTVSNLVAYIKNTKITSFTLKGIVEGVENNTKLQLSSKSQGSDGYIQVTGGNANLKLAFATVVYRGLQAYSYWTGLLKLVHKTIYGDDSDLASYAGVGAAGVIFRVLAPTIKNISVELDVTLQEGISIAAIENDVKSAVSGYVNTLGLADDVIIERIRAAVIAIPGITDVVINSPTANIVIADNERAQVSDPSILIG